MLFGGGKYTSAHLSSTYFIQQVPEMTDYDAAKAAVMALQDDILAGNITEEQLNELHPHPAGFQRLQQALRHELPFCFPDMDSFEEFKEDCKHAISVLVPDYDGLKIFPTDIIILGSSVTGYSMHPGKNMKPWQPPESDNPSDVDVAFCAEGLVRSIGHIITGSSQPPVSYRDPRYNFVKIELLEKKLQAPVLEVMQKWKAKLGTQVAFKVQASPGAPMHLLEDRAMGIVRYSPSYPYTFDSRYFVSPRTVSWNPQIGMS